MRVEEALTKTSPSQPGELLVCDCNINFISRSDQSVNNSIVKIFKIFFFEINRDETKR